MERLIKLSASVRQAPVGSNLLLLLDICLPKVTGVCVCVVCVCGVCVCVCVYVCVGGCIYLMRRGSEPISGRGPAPGPVLHLRTSVWVAEPSKLKALWKAERQNRSLFG